MIELSITLVIAVILYLLPGYIVLNWFYLQGVSHYHRLFLSLGLSLVIVPTAFILIANFYPYRPGFWPWTILVVFLLGITIILRHRSARISFDLISPNHTSPIVPGRWEHWGFLVFLLLFTAFVNLPRVSMLIHGDMPLEVGPWDEHWHISQLVSVARTGIPPLHYFFPSINLAYYYASWIYPAIFGNLSFISISLSRAMAIHVFVQILTFLGLISVLLQVNFTNKWTRISGLLFFTIFGGFDLYAKLPGVEFIDWWQRDPSWLIGQMQISQFATLYSWVPHHIAGGMTLLLLILFWKNIQTHIIVKVIGSSIFLAFCFLTSPFVFFMSGLAIIIVLTYKWQQLWTNRSKTFLFLVLMGVCFAAIVWNSFFIYIEHPSSLTWNEFRISVVERFRGNTDVNLLLDRALTILGLPVVGSAVLLVDMGLVYILYLLWWGKRILSRTRIFDTTESVLLGIFPLISFLLVVIIKDEGGGRNFAMRGLIPAQIIIVFAALQILEEFYLHAQKIGWKRWIVIYVAVCFLVAQGFSTFAEIRSTSVKAVKLALWNECGWPTLFRQTVNFDEYCVGQDKYKYIYWLNQNTPSDALILETGTFEADSIKIRWLERNRLVVPQEFLELEFFYYDMDFVLPDDWNQLIQHSQISSDVVDLYNRLDFRYKDQQHVYLVVGLEKQTSANLGLPVFADDWVKIYYLGMGANNP